MNLNNRLRRWTLFIICTGSSLLGCGIYSFSGSTVPSHIKTVAIPLFTDNTAEFGIDQKLTDALMDAVTRDNTLKVSGSRGGDSMLSGTIIRVEDRAGQYDQNENATDFRVTITIKIIFEDIKKRKVMWEETYTQWGSYDNTETLRENGIDEAIVKLTADILNKTVSGW